MSFPLPFDNLVLRNYKNLTNDQLETIRKVFCSALVHMQIKYKIPIKENPNTTKKAPPKNFNFLPLKKEKCPNR